MKYGYYLLVVIGCALAIAMLLVSDLNPPKSSFEMYFSNYSSKMAEGQNVTFSLVLKASDADSPLAMSVLFDGKVEKTMRFASPSGTLTLGFDMDNDFKSGERHTVSVELYDENQPYSKYNSAVHPDYLFFRVDVA